MHPPAAVALNKCCSGAPEILLAQVEEKLLSKFLSTQCERVLYPAAEFLFQKGAGWSGVSSMCDLGALDCTRLSVVLCAPLISGSGILINEDVALSSLLVFAPGMARWHESGGTALASGCYCRYNLLCTHFALLKGQVRQL